MAKTKTVSPMIDDDSLIARALYEASLYHLHKWDPPEFEADEAVGRRMRAILSNRYPDAQRGFEDAERLRKALNSGYLPLAGGATPEDVRAFLDARKGPDDDGAVGRPTQDRRQILDTLGDADLPF